tara:strand:+ start:3106 stop:3804 length:699 start_codon:yes stop_codon:yes gene_type:complete
MSVEEITDSIPQLKLEEKIEIFKKERSTKIIQRGYKKHIDNKVYEKLTDYVWVFQGMKICEGFITQDIIYNIIKNSNKYDQVYQEFKIPLNPDDSKKRKHHKVDILCINNKDKVVDAYNSKGASFNNTQSQENDLAEFNKYKEAIKNKYPGHEVNYSILKDNYDKNDPKYKLKCEYLSNNGINHYNTQGFLKNKFNNPNFEKIRRKQVAIKLQARIRERGLPITLKQLISNS